MDQTVLYASRLLGPMIQHSPPPPPDCRFGALLTLSETSFDMLTSETKLGEKGLPAGSSQAKTLSTRDTFFHLGLHEGKKSHRMMKPQQDLCIHGPKRSMSQAELIERRMKSLKERTSPAAFPMRKIRLLEAISQMGFISGLDNEQEKHLGCVAP